MEYVGDYTLHDRIQCPNFADKDILFSGYEIIYGLMYLHQQLIIHRDIKEDNISIDSHGHCKITDLNMSKIIPLNGKTRTKVGIDENLAPEFYSGDGYDFAVDYWALGVLLFLCVTKEVPFKNKNDICNPNLDPFKLESFLKKKVSNDLKDLIKKLFSRNSVERIHTENDFNEDVLDKLKNVSLEIEPFRVDSNVYFIFFYKFLNENY